MQLINIRVGILSKCSSKPEFNVNRVLLPFPVILHHWRWPCNLHNPKGHLSPGYPCMRQWHCSHKGMDIGISYLVVHFHVCKKFFQVLSLMSSVHHLVVLLENLLPLHLDCLSILECSLDPGHHLNCWEYTRVLSGSWSLSELNDRQWHTGLVGVCGELWGVMVTVLWGVVCTGLKDACSMLDT